MTLTVSRVVLCASPRMAGWARLTANLHSDVDGNDEDVWFEVPQREASALTPSSDAFLASLAPLAALRHEPLHITEPVDALLLEQVREVTRIWAAWYPELKDVPITAPTSPRAEGGERLTASMFTGGVDSFFTALRHDAGEGTPATVKIDELIYVHGFDIPLANMAAWTHVTESLQRAASTLGKHLMLVATNLRDTRFGKTDWPRLSHGAALAAVGHALGNRYGTVLIGSSAGYRDLRFWGSHPLTDPMFTSSRVRILHDGAAFMRVEKIEYVAQSPIAMRHLRICWKSTTGDNCGECNNCYRTMLALDALGVLDACVTLERASLDMRQAGRIYCRHDFDFRQFGYVRDLARRCGRSDIAAAVEHSVKGSHVLARRLALVNRLRAPLGERWASALERRLIRGWID